MEFVRSMGVANPGFSSVTRNTAPSLKTAPASSVVAWRAFSELSSGTITVLQIVSAGCYLLQSRATTPHIDNSRRRLGGALRRWCARRLPVPSKVRHNAKYSLDHHQLSPVMHFVLFGPDEHLKPVFQSATRHAHVFRQQRLRELLHPLAPAISFLK